MSSASENSHELFLEVNTEVEKMNTSPVTNLALNMKSLTTSLTGTPSRRISWSNPFPVEYKSNHFLSEFSPSADSPTFQEISYRMKNSVRKPWKALPSDSDEEKENVVPKETISFESLKKDSESDSFENFSQDSGYSSLSKKSFEISALNSTPFSKVKSSAFDDQSEDGFDNLIHMEDANDDRIHVPLSNMTSLLTKPLCSNLELEIIPSDAITKTDKLPIRRCLSMEMEFDKNSKMDCVSKTGTYIAPTVLENEKDADLESKKCPFKRPDPPNIYSAVQSKRRKSSPSVDLSEEVISDENNFVFQRSFSETAATIMYAVQKADLQPNLIGDCSKNYALPLVNGRHQDLKSISPQTLVQVLKGEFSHEIETYTLVDCRYPYEFDAGHIQGAKNIYTKEEILETFLTDTPTSCGRRHILIFHCEFSSERAPNLCRFLRNKDREMNEDNYPHLHHPEIYILEGGYKAFFKAFKEYCEPQDYKPMNHKDHSLELRQFRSKSKSWGTDSKSRYKMKSTSMKEIL